MKTSELLSFFEQWAPTRLAEDYDNVGLLAGRPDQEITRVMVSLDATEEVVLEAHRNGCQLLISHHPILFKGIKRLNGQNYVARSLETAIRNQVGLMAVHTNLDHVQTGVNARLASELELESPRILRPVHNKLQMLSFFVPMDHAKTVIEAVHAAGAGDIGNYSHCSFSTQGLGRFMPESGSDPYMGKKGQLEEVQEYKVEVILPDTITSRVLNALFKAHPYEQVAYFIHHIENPWQEVGAGMVGNLKTPMEFPEFLKMVKSKLGTPVLRHTRPTGKKIERVAICGGAGFFLLGDAIAAGADILLTSDIKYHEFFDAEDKIILIDAGHFETEQFTSAWIKEKISAQFPNIAVLLSETRTNPVLYA
jgi:dinuclear metal center YbgI/SA1388 family protein